MTLNTDRAREISEALKGLPAIPGLGFQPTAQYETRSIEDILYPLIVENDVLVVGGAFFGDEGKGKLVDAIARHPLIYIVMRTNSGENAGHTVFFNGKKYVFHMMPSGVLIPGKTNLIGPECVMDPVNFMQKEVAQLIAAGIPYDNLFAGNVKIVAPYDKLLDFVSKPSNSSTLQGISPAHSAKVSKTGLRLDDLFCSHDHQARIISKDMERYTALLALKGWDSQSILEKCLEMNAGGNKRFPDHLIGFLQAADSEKVDYIINIYAETVSKNPDFPARADTRKILRDSLREGKKALLEGSQSNLLSNACEKHWRSSTSADTTANGIIASAGYNPRKHKTAVINVHKLPPSRVGLGANPAGLVAQDYFSKQGIDTLEKVAGKCEDVEAIVNGFFASIGENGIIEPRVYVDADGGEYLLGEALAITWSRKFGECGATTKKPRVLGFFDCVMQYEVNESQGPYLSISAVDRMDDCEKFGLCVAYVYYDPEGIARDSNGKSYSNFDVIRPGEQIPNENVLSHCHPIIKVLDGWKGEPIAAGKRDASLQLPAQVQELIGTIEHFTGSQVISIGNGPAADDIIYLKRK